MTFISGIVDKLLKQSTNEMHGTVLTFFKYVGCHSNKIPFHFSTRTVYIAWYLLLTEYINSVYDNLLSFMQYGLILVPWRLSLKEWNV